MATALHYKTWNSLETQWHTDFNCYLSSSLFYPILAERELLILQDLEDLEIQEDQNAVFVCEISVEDIPGEWYKKGERIQPTSTIKIRQEGTCSSQQLAGTQCLNVERSIWVFSCYDYQGPNTSCSCVTFVLKTLERSSLWPDTSNLRLTWKWKVTAPMFFCYFSVCEKDF